MVDLFNEVDEELRSDRYRSFFSRALPWLIALVVAVILAYFGTYAVGYFQDQKVAKATSEYQNGLQALSRNDNAGAFAHFEAAAKAGSPVYAALALSHEAGIRASAGKTAEAVSLYDAAAKAYSDPVFADLNSLKAAELLLDTAPYAQLVTRLTPLTDKKRPYWIYAKEALAMAKLMAGKTAAARADFNVLSLTIGVTDDMRQRAQQTIQLIDSGEAPAAIAGVKAAASLPPSPPPNILAPTDAAPADGAPSPVPSGAAQ